MYAQSHPEADHMRAFQVQTQETKAFMTLDLNVYKGDVQVSGENCPEPKGTIWYFNWPRGQ